MSTNGSGPSVDEPDSPEPERPGPRAAYAVKWRTVLVVAALMGGGVALIGVFVLAAWSVAIGVVLTGLGALYVALVARRARQWQRLRADAGL